MGSPFSGTLTTGSRWACWRTSSRPRRRARVPDAPHEIADLREGHAFLVGAAAFFPLPDPRLATCAGDGTTRLWNRVTGGQLRVLERTGQSAIVALSADGRWILTGGEKNAALLWDGAEDGPPVALDGHTSEVTAVAFSHTAGGDSQRIATGDANGVCKLWKRQSPTEPWRVYAELQGASARAGHHGDSFSARRRRGAHCLPGPHGDGLGNGDRPPDRAAHPEAPRGRPRDRCFARRVASGVGLSGRRCLPPLALGSPASGAIEFAAGGGGSDGDIHRFLQRRPRGDCQPRPRRMAPAPCDVGRSDRNDTVRCGRIKFGGGRCGPPYCQPMAARC